MLIGSNINCEYLAKREKWHGKHRIFSLIAINLFTLDILGVIILYLIGRITGWWSI